MKYLFLLLLPGFVLANCNVVPIGGTCTINADCPLNGVTNTYQWNYPSGPPFCDATCHLHTPTVAHPSTWVSAGSCALGGVCFGSQTVNYSITTPSGDCVSGICSSGACTTFTPWMDQACAVNGCAANEMSQTRNGTAPNCCAPTSEHQCVANIACGFIPPPPPPTCGAGHVCGNVSAYERPTQMLHDMVVELYDSKFLRHVTTDINGHYDIPMAAGNYVVRAMPDRTWNPVPNHAYVTPNNIVTKGNFMMMRVPAVVTVLAPVGTFVAFTRTPILTPSIPDGSDYFSAVTDLDNKRKVNVYGGSDYYMTCWKLNTTVWPYVEVKGPSQRINGGAVLWPQDQISETCL